MSAADGIIGFTNHKDETQDVQQVQECSTKSIQEVHEVHDVQQDLKEEDRPLGTTQGRRGQKAKRINMAFSDANHRFITMESRRRGLSATVFVNQIIDEYKSRLS